MSKPKEFYCIQCGREYDRSAAARFMLRCGHLSVALVSRAAAAQAFDEQQAKRRETPVEDPPKQA